MVAFLCFLILGERLGKLEIVSIFSAMFGLILMTNPQVIFPSMESHLKGGGGADGIYRTESDYKMGIFCALLGAVSGSFVYVVCRKLGNQVHVSIHPMFMALTSGLGAVLFLACSNYTISALNYYDMILITICGVCSWIQ